MDVDLKKKDRKINLLLGAALALSLTGAYHHISNAENKLDSVRTAEVKVSQSLDGARRIHRPGPKTRLFISKKEGEKPEPIMAELARSLPFESLDCSLPDVSKAGSAIGKDALAKMIKKAKSFETQVSVIEDSSEISGCLSGFGALEDCTDDPLTLDIGRIKDEKIPEKLAAVINYLDSLGLQAESGKWIYEAYLDSADEAMKMGKSMPLDGDCLDRLLYAKKILEVTKLRLMEKLMDDPASVPAALDNMKESRWGLMVSLSSILLEEYGAKYTEYFYGSLPEKYQGEFLGHFHHIVMLSESDCLATAKELSKNASDPRLKDAMVAALEKQKELKSRLANR